MVAHEYAHAEAAYRQGDDTAYMLGRLTLNPLKHIDPIMTVLVPVILWVSHAGFLFGAAKPVPVNPRKYRNFVRGDVIVSLAGIVVNLALFVVFTSLFGAVGLVGQRVPSLVGSLGILQDMTYYGMRLNLILAFFNLIPIPPLDGSHVFYHLLPPGAGLKYRQLYMLGFIPILLISWLAPGVITLFLWPADRLMQLGLAVVGGFRIVDWRAAAGARRAGRFARGFMPEARPAPPAPLVIELNELLAAAERVIALIPEPVLHRVVPRPLDVEGATERIQTLLGEREECSWLDVVGERASVVDVQSAFIALLELARRGALKLCQDGPFAPIVIRREPPRAAA